MIDRLGHTTREINQTGVYVDVTATGTAANALPTLGVRREVRLDASVTTWIRFGTNSGGTLDTAASKAGTSYRVQADQPEWVRVPAGCTHFAVLRDGSSDGKMLVHAAV